MAEFIDIFTKQGEKLGKLSRKEYYSLQCDESKIPWIKCCSCFVIDKNSNKILWEKRGKNFLDSGKLDLCSGHVRSGEAPFQGMIRELKEEVSIQENDARNLHYLGEIKVDYTNLEDETNRKRLKCFVSMYGLEIPDISQIKIDHQEVINKGWLNYEDTKCFIENSMTRMPYEEDLRSQYDVIFQKLHEYMFEKNKRFDHQAVTK